MSGRRTGFTLVEMMIALAIAAMMAVMAAPSFTTFMRNSEVRTAAESLANGLRVARSEAVRRNQGVAFVMTTGTSAMWGVRQVSDGAVIQAVPSSDAVNAVAVARTPGDATTVQFNALGRIQAPGAGGPANVRQIDVASALDTGARVLRILVDETNGIRTCDPSPLLVGLTPPDPRACP